MFSIILACYPEMGVEHYPPMHELNIGRMIQATMSQGKRSVLGQTTPPIEIQA